MPRSVWLRRGGERDHAVNEETVCPFGRFGALSVTRSEPSFHDLFVTHYEHIRRLMTAHPEPGLALFVAAHDGLEASAWWPVRSQDINPLIVGRHSTAEVFVPSDESLSLRHLAVILLPLQDGERVRFRVLDLRTPSAFRDESGRLLEAMEGDGPLLIRFASLTALLLPTGGLHKPWPNEPERAWETVPRCLSFESETADPERWLHLTGRRPWGSPEAFDLSGGSPTLSTTFPGPSFIRRNVVGAECPRGELLVRCAGRRMSLRLGRTAMRQGVLLGRYDRCDNGGVDVLTDGALSRVHLLLVELAGRFYAVDTASKNGVWQGTRRARCVRFEHGLRLALANAETVVEWRPIH